MEIFDASGSSENGSMMGDYYGDDYYLNFYNDPLIQTDMNIILYLSPFLLFLSTLGNILSCVVLCRLSYEVWSSCVYLAIMCVLDLFIVYTWCGDRWLLQITQVSMSDKLLLSSVSICKVYMFLFSAVLHMDRWMMVCLAIDLYIAARLPNKVSQMCTLSRTKAVILLITVILVCINLHFFWTYEILYIRDVNPDTAKNYTCTFVKQGVPHSEVFEDVIWPVIDLSVAQILPLVLITLFTLLTVVECIRGKGLSDCKEKTWRKKYLLYPNAMKQLKTSMLIICILYVLTVPKFILDIHQTEWGEVFGNGSGAADDLDEELDYDYLSSIARGELLRTVFSYLEYVFFSVKFYILFFMCRQFRVECFNICGQLCKKKDSKVSRQLTRRQQKGLCRRVCTALGRVCRCYRAGRRTVSTVNSRHILMASNQSSTEFHVEPLVHSNHSYRHPLQSSTDNSLCMSEVERAKP